jgi:DNA-directed RNA polymerase specialized sigma24 family protein
MTNLSACVSEAIPAPAVGSLVPRGRDERAEGARPAMGSTTPLDISARLCAAHQELFHWLHLRLGCPTLAEDILQDAFVRGAHERESLTDDEPVVAWFFRVLRDALVDYQWRHEVTNHDLAALAAELDRNSTPPPELRGVIGRCIARLAENLGPDYARAVRRVELDGISVQSYAIEVSVRNRNLVVVQIFLAREALRKQVQRACKTPIAPDGVTR